MPWSIIGHVLLVDVMLQVVQHGIPVLCVGVVGPAAVFAGCEDNPQVPGIGQGPGNDGISPAGARGRQGHRLSGGSAARRVTVVHPVLVGGPRWDVGIALIIQSVPN